MKNVVWTGSASGLDGEFQSGSEVDVYIDGVSVSNVQSRSKPLYSLDQP